MDWNRSTPTDTSPGTSSRSNRMEIDSENSGEELGEESIAQGYSGRLGQLFTNNGEEDATVGEDDFDDPRNGDNTVISSSSSEDGGDDPGDPVPVTSNSNSDCSDDAGSDGSGEESDEDLQNLVQVSRRRDAAASGSATRLRAAPTPSYAAPRVAKALAPRVSPVYHGPPPSAAAKWVYRMPAEVVAERRAAGVLFHAMLKAKGTADGVWHAPPAHILKKYGKKDSI